MRSSCRHVMMELDKNGKKERRIVLRNARKEDAAGVLPLMMDAIGDIAYSLTGEESPGEAMAVLEEFYCREGNRLSYENVTVLEKEGRVAAFMLAYHGSRAEVLDRPLKARLEASGKSAAAIVCEAGSDEYYLDSLAVHPDFRGQGLGTLLLEEFGRLAAQAGWGKLSLLVEEHNGGARKLYERLGYAPQDALMVAGHRYDRMVKQV
ncbi:GNAT family N-acetyltransferase [Paenibacillus mesotrionivorans]|uniref:GNAT family N-acetyltransferase n=1 Tax=Paenibacillus mesotrionivorans TaxID=3160968 RepID=A0ACC7NR08_9BACL